MHEIARARSFESMPTLQRLIEQSGAFPSSAGAAVLVIDRRLFGPNDSAADVSILTLTSNGVNDHEPAWRIASEFETTYESILPTVALLGGRPGSSLSKPLVLLIDVAELELAPFLSELLKVRPGFSSVDVYIAAALEEDCYAPAALREYLNENRILIRALQLGGMFLVNEEERLDIDPSSIGTFRFATSLGRFLHDLSQGAPKNADRRVAIMRVKLDADEPSSDRPFFTILTRTQGKRMHSLREVFCCLSAQTCLDFEHLIVGHNLSESASFELEALVAQQAEPLKSRVRLLPVNGGNRTKPLNQGFANARGLYTVILDDDDLVLANWLEVFRDLAIKHPGRLLRAASVRQEFEQVTTNGRIAARAFSGMRHEFGGKFDLVQHLVENRTPPVSVAFPTFVFSEIGYKFDETLTTTEDWDYILRCAGLVDVACSEEITSIYRWWTNADSSRTDHQRAEWIENHERIDRKIDGTAYLTPTDSTRTIRNLGRRFQDVEHFTKMIEAEISFYKTALRDRALGVSPDALPTNDLLEELIPLLDLTGEQEEGRSRAELKRSAVARSGLFDADYYLETNDDVRASGMDPLDHFAEHGCRELRSPGPTFDSIFYYLDNKDIAAKRVDPFFHFIGYGKHEGRRPRQR